VTVTCQTCTAPVGDAYLCGGCTNQLRATLEAIPTLTDELDTTITRQAVLGVRGGPRAAEKPLPFHAQASEAAWVLRNTLGGWARVLDAEIPLGGPGRGLETISSLSGSTSQGSQIATAEIARYLTSRLEQLRHHQAAGEAHDEIRGAVEAATRAIDRPANDRTYIGPCTCGTELYANPGRTTTTCRDCDTTHDVEARRESMREQLRDHLGTASYVATVATGLGVTVAASTVRMWAQRQHLESRGTKEKPLYRVGDVIDVAKASPEERRRAKVDTQKLA
jgi:hypothetical protein